MDLNLNDMKNEPLVSIITVVFNRAETIEQTIQSVLNQSYTNIEYIIIDGASTDGTQAIIENYRDFLTCFISEKDNGIYDAMNKGIQNAKGEIVGIINSDDWYELDAVEHMVKIFVELPDIDVLYGNINLVDSSGSRKKQKQLPFSYLCYGMVVSHPATFVKKYVYEEYGLFDDTFQIAADLELMNRFYNQKLQFAHTKRVIANFRLTGISNTKLDVRYEEKKKVFYKYFDPDLFTRICDEKFLQNDLPIFVFGAGEWGRRVIFAFKHRQVTVNKCLDNNNEKWGTEVYGIPISSPELLREISGQVIIAVKKYEGNIVEQLRRMDLKKCHLIKLSDCLEEYATAIAERNGKCLEVE